MDMVDQKILYLACCDILSALLVSQHSPTILEMFPRCPLLILRNSCLQVQNFLLHFWQGMPPHIVPILDSPTIVMLVGVCDSILYRAIAAVLMPTVLQALPDR